MAQQLRFIHEISILFPEPVNPAFRIHQFLLSCEERMGEGSDIARNDVVRNAVNVSRLTARGCRPRNNLVPS